MGTTRGLFRSSNHGYSWQPDTLGMGGTGISAIGITPAGTLYAGTAGRGVYRQGSLLAVPYHTAPATTPPVTDVQVAPNPASNPSSVSFTLGSPLRLSFTLRDPGGRLISTLADGEFETGRQSIAFDAGGLASGVYYLVIEGDGGIASQRVVVVR